MSPTHVKTTNWGIWSAVRFPGALSEAHTPLLQLYQLGHAGAAAWLVVGRCGGGGLLAMETGTVMDQIHTVPA